MLDLQLCEVVFMFVAYLFPFIVYICIMVWLRPMLRIKMYYETRLQREEGDRLLLSRLLQGIFYGAASHDSRIRE